MAVCLLLAACLQKRLRGTGIAVAQIEQTHATLTQTGKMGHLHLSCEPKILRSLNRSTKLVFVRKEFSKCLKDEKVEKKRGTLNGQHFPRCLEM